MFHQVIEQQKRAYFAENPIENSATAEIDENDERCYETPQIFIHQLFKLYRKGLVDDKNIRDQVYLMVREYHWNIMEFIQILNKFLISSDFCW